MWISPTKSGSTPSWTPLPWTEAVKDGFWETYRQLTARLSATGISVQSGLVPDVHLAAILYFHGVKVIYTKDRDFDSFDFIEARDPFPEKKPVSPE